MRALSVAVTAVIFGLLPTAQAAAQRGSDKAVQALRDPARLVGLGQRLEGQGDLANAMNFYDRALELDSAYVPALQAAGENALRRQSPAAFDYYARWAALKPEDPAALLGLGSSLLHRQQPTEALAALKRAGELGAPAWRVALQRGIALDLMAQQRDAQLAYAQALQGMPNDREAVQRMALSLAISGDYQASLQLLQRFANEPGGGADDVRRTLAKVYALSGQQEAAVEIAGVAMSPDEARALAPFYARLPDLKPEDKALAVHFNRLPVGALAESAPKRQPTPVEPPVPVIEAPEPRQVSVAEAPVQPPERKTTPAPQFRPLGMTLGEAKKAERIWVQLSSQTQRDMLTNDWRQVRRETATLLGAFRPFVQRSGANHRLLVGPFASSRDAEALIRQLKARRVGAVVNRTPAGADLQPLALP